MTDNKNKPTIMWTFRRTGGTTLMTLLTLCSGLDYWEHEPFNQERIFGFIVKKWSRDRNITWLKQELTKIIAQKRMIKHCIEMVDFGITSQLLKLSLTDYQHLILLRKSEEMRMFSLFIANQTGAWGPDGAKPVISRLISGEDKLQPIDPTKVRNQLVTDASRLGRLFRLGVSSGASMRTVFYEDIFSGNYEVRAARVAELTESLGYDLSLIDTKRLGELLIEQSQETPLVHRLVPNFMEISALASEFSDE